MNRADIRWIVEGRSASGRWCGDSRKFKTRDAAMKGQPGYASKYPADFRDSRRQGGGARG